MVDLVILWAITALVSVFMMLGASLYAIAKAGKNKPVPENALIFVLLALVTMFVPVINIIMATLATIIYVREVRFGFID